jgi:putative DNA primase/helicase
MLGKFVSPTNKPVTWHITYLEKGLKAKVEHPRKVMPQLDADDGGAIRLYPPAEEMGIAEGIETAIAAKMIHGIPVWAAMNAQNLAKFVPPKNIGKLYIFGDNDESAAGQAAAFDLARRLYRRVACREVRIPSFYNDWNDVLLHDGKRAA